MPAPPTLSLLTPETLLASGKGSERLSLPALQSKMKCDPEGYESELVLLRRHFGSSLQLFRHQSALAPSSDPAVAKDLGDFAMFLAHVSPLYPSHLADFPGELMDLLRSDAGSLPSSLRCHLAQALILLVNRKLVGIEETLELFMDLQILGDRTLRKLAFSHVVHSIRRMNQKHKNEANNRKLQNILFFMLQKEDEARAKRALVVLSDLHRRRVWFDDRTANAICTSCFHSSSRIMISALSFLLGYDQVEEEDDSDDSDGEDDTTNQNAQILLSREAVYKAHHKGTTSSKKKKKAKLQRVARSMKKQQRISSENNSNWYSPLAHLQDAQGFAEKLFSRLQKCNERFEVKMMMLKVIARTVGMHRLVLLNFYPFLQKYIKAQQRDVTNLLAAAVQACHDLVPPDAVEPLFRQIVDQFVHDRSRTEAIAVGLNVVREICLRMPLLMNEDLLQDLVLYKKSHEKAVSTAARSLVVLFREICPSLLVKKDRGRPTNPKAKPKAFGEVNVETNVPGLELLENDGDSMSESSDDELITSNDEDGLLQSTLDSGDNIEALCESKENNGSVEDAEEGEAAVSDEEEDDEDTDKLMDDTGIISDGCNSDGDMDDDDDDDDNDRDDEEEEEGEEEEEEELAEKSHAEASDSEDDIEDEENDEEENGMKKSKSQKRKFGDYVGKLNDTSLRALKRLAGSNMSSIPSELDREILSNEDFQRIKELKAKKEAKLALSQQGLLRKGSDSKSAAFKLPSSEQLSLKRVDPAKLEIHVKRKLSKEERLALVKAGREDRVKYQARTATKQNKTGGLSNRQKEHKKAMPLAAKRAKVARSRQEKRKQQRRAGKQFRGKKAWK
ncbi:hypothetical protein J5N97_002810 [Dioscorea zingiberensis]|uniref:Protein SDA1 n=1 Tax=Dioscorea zingiberensis TaxID=325984 RepID=A0A9D5HPR8_9LILI|nr:hypothetical protein J5N97_002810 [Dioscorea zingiberensis]